MTPATARSRIILLTAVAMTAFAANSLLCRLALRAPLIDAASFTLIRIVAAALTLSALLRLRGDNAFRHGTWTSGFALFAYAAGFSFAYISLPAAVGALLLFGAVQTTMIGYALWRGERLSLPQSGGLALACAGLVGLMAPGLSAPPLLGALLMIAAGVAWGVYSLRGRSGGGGDATAVTAGNFIRATPFAVALSLIASPETGTMTAAGVGYAVASGALASGLGYAIWYTALPSLRASNAATVQLSVPIIAALGGALTLGEDITLRLVVASVAVLGGVALVIAGRRAGA